MGAGMQITFVEEMHACQRRDERTGKRRRSKMQKMRGTVHMYVVPFVAIVTKGDMYLRGGAG
jgi:hypothetical protein